MRILGVDPGSRLTGFGCIDLLGNQIRPVTYGTLRLSNTGGRAEIPLEERLFKIFDGLSKIITEHKPDVVVVEKVFFAKNAVSALKLGQARGVVLLSARFHEVAVVEYSPSEVKSAVVGHGHADKDQVARFVQLLTGVKDFATSDASDGLALAICHAFLSRGKSAPKGAQKSAYAAVHGSADEKSDNRDLLRSASGQRRTKKRLSLAEAMGIGPGGIKDGKRIEKK